MAESADALATIELFYQAALEPELWPEALHRLALAVGGFGTAMIPITPGRTSGLVLSPELLESRAEYDREWFRHDTRVSRIHARKLKDGVTCEAELFTKEEIARDPMRQEFCRPFGMGSFAAQLVTPMPDFVVAFSIMRGVERGEFEKRELETLDLLGRHAARALVIAMQLAAARGAEQSLFATLAAFHCAALVVDRGGKVIFANEAAETLLGDGIAMQQGALVATSREHRSAFASFLRSALRLDAAASELQPVALPRPSGKLPLIVQAMPVQAAQIDWSMSAAAAALILVVDPERGRDGDPQKELRLLGLTPSEARLAVLMGKGLSRGEAADALGLSTATVSSTVRDIYSKLDITRQSELVRLLDRLSVLSSAQV